MAGRKASKVDLRLGSEFLDLTPHLAQWFGTDDVHRRLAMLSLDQAGELFQLLHRAIVIGRNIVKYKCFNICGINLHTNVSWNIFADLLT